MPTMRIGADERWPEFTLDDYGPVEVALEEGEFTRFQARYNHVMEQYHTLQRDLGELWDANGGHTV